MRSWFALAMTSILVGLSSTAVAAPIAVTYGFGGAPASFSIDGVGGPNNITSGTLTVVYGTGSTVANGTVGPLSTATMAGIQLSATGPVATFQVGNLTNWSAFLGFNGFPGTPSGDAAVQVFNVGLGLIAFNGFGGAGGTFTWEIDNGANGNILGSEINRSVVPEPSTGLMLFAGLSGLGLYGRRLLRR